MAISSTSPAIQITYTITTVVPVVDTLVTNAAQAQLAIDAPGADVDMVLRKFKLLNNDDALYSKSTATAVDVSVVTTITPAI